MKLYLRLQQTFLHLLKSVLKGLAQGSRYLRKVPIIPRHSQEVNYKTNVVFVPLLLALLLPGCAIVNPNVSLERPGSEKLKPQDSAAEKHYTLSQGIQYAEGAIEKYDNYISSNNWFSGTMGVLMIGVSAAALALGITDGGATAIAALGVSGASLFGIGTFLSDSSRNAIYNEGKEKVICAIAAVQPLFLSPEQIEKFKNSLEAIKTEIANVQTDIENVRVAKAGVNDPVLLALAQNRIDSAQETIKAAESAYEVGTKIDLQLSRAGNALITAVDGINAEVNKMLAGTVGSLEAANTIIGGLATTSTRLITVPKEVVNQAETAKDEASPKSLTPDQQNRLAVGNQLSNALFALAQSNGRLGGAVALVAVIAGEIEPSLENLGQCKLNIQELTLSVKPESIEFTKGIAGTRRLIILTGKKPFAAQLLEHPVNGLTIDQPVPFGSTVEVKATDQIADGKYHLHIVDGAERHVFIEIVVKEN
jgi:hypothetical protein